MVQAMAEAHGLQFGLGALEGVVLAGELQRAAPRSRAPSWWARDGRTGTRCRCAGRESARAHPRRGRDRSVPSTTTLPESGRSSPAMVMSRVDLPEPEGPTRPTASPLPTLREMPLRICTRAAPRPRLKSTSCSAMALSCMPYHPICWKTVQRRPVLVPPRWEAYR